MAGLTFALLAGCVTSEAVTVWLGALFNVRLTLRVPAASAPLAGNTALVSLELIATVSVTFVRRFQLASTALTVTLNAVPATWPLGVPVLPLAVPGAAVSPGTSNCNLLNAPGLTTTTDEVAEFNPLA